MPLSSSYVPIHLLLAQRSVQEWQTIFATNHGIFAHYPNYCLRLAHYIEKSQAQRIILAPLDRAHFLAGLLAALHAGKEIIIPNSQAPGLIESLIQDNDLYLDYSHHQLALNDSADHKPKTLPSKSNIYLYTSGSTGTPKLIQKRIDQLEAEITTLDHLWGSQCGQPLFLATVPHYHIYGLLFSLLWPVCAGYRIHNETFSFWEDFMNFYQPQDYLISSPAHLSRLPSGHTFSPFTHIFSSGAPLALPHAQTIYSHFGIYPREVFGSTETGGIAYRQQTNANQPWTPFPNIEICLSDDHLLQVKSPYLPDQNFYKTEDKISITDNHQFHLHGRVDQIVKIEGKRVSLKEIEQRLAECEEVQENTVLPLDMNNRQELGVIAVLTDKGQKSISSLGKIQFVQHLKAFLSQYFDSVTLPRKWRFVEAIPVDERGKRPLSLLKELFEMTHQEAHRTSNQPEILSKDISDCSVVVLMRIPENLDYLNGHFPDFPIVPGVVQLHWAVHISKDTFSISGVVNGASQIKFSHIMRPNDTVQLTLTHHPNQHQITYQYTGENSLYSSGRFTYEP